MAALGYIAWTFWLGRSYMLKFRILLVPHMPLIYVYMWGTPKQKILRSLKMERPFCIDSIFRFSGSNPEWNLRLSKTYDVELLGKKQVESIVDDIH